MRGCCSHLFPPVPEVGKTPRPLCPKGSRVILTCSRVALYIPTEKEETRGGEGERERIQCIETPSKPCGSWLWLISGTGRNRGVFPRTAPQRRLVWNAEINMWWSLSPKAVMQFLALRVWRERWSPLAVDRHKGFISLRCPSIGSGSVDAVTANATVGVAT